MAVEDKGTGAAVARWLGLLILAAYLGMYLYAAGYVTGTREVCEELLRYRLDASVFGVVCQGR